MSIVGTSNCVITTSEPLGDREATTNGPPTECCVTIKVGGGEATIAVVVVLPGRWRSQAMLLHSSTDAARTPMILRCLLLLVQGVVFITVWASIAANALLSDRRGGGSLEQIVERSRCAGWTI